MTTIISPLRFAIVGCGRIAARHAEHIRTVGTLAAVCDIDPQRAADLGTQHGATPYTDLASLLSREAGHLDVISICTPNGLHAEHAIRSLQAGCHVLCEKPMAIHAADAARMIHAAERANRRLFVVKQNRLNPPVVAVKQALDEGRLGRLFSVQLNCFWNRNDNYYRDSWKGTLDLDGGCLYTQFSHFIDLLYWYLGDVHSVHTLLANYAHQDTVEFEDSGVVIIEFASGVIGSLHFTINSHRQNMEGSITIFAEKGTVKIGGQYLNELEYQSIEGYCIENLPPGRPPNQYGEYVGSMSNHDKVYENVVNVLLHNAAIVANALEGLKTVEIIEKIYAANGQWSRSSLSPIESPRARRPACIPTPILSR
ncbi:MAG: Gfo/Idh/MocA family oxidoreductase [Planctomycetota bacterium]|nr:Gfo/Idh/MocA family oxidoreductase [Planctomycetota bacterium]